MTLMNQWLSRQFLIQIQQQISQVLIFENICLHTFDEKMVSRYFWELEFLNIFWPSVQVYLKKWPRAPAEVGSLGLPLKMEILSGSMGLIRLCQVRLKG